MAPLKKMGPRWIQKNSWAVTQMENSRSEREGSGPQVIILKVDKSPVGFWFQDSVIFTTENICFKKLCEDVPGYFSEYFEEHIPLILLS